MIVVTGGAGFIGSALVWALNNRGRDNILVVDHLGHAAKWRNLVGLRFADYLDKTVFIEGLEKGRFGDTIEAILHMGACSSTTETNADYLIENNYGYTARIAAWREAHRRCRLIYASSAATYGDGSRGYTDDETRLETLRPLNMYGYSKHLFDLRARREGWLKTIAGLKYFNVFGPNEGHKGAMRSVINKAYPGVRDEGRIRLFRSHRPDYANGEQQRDFIYVKDAAAMTLFFLEHPEVSGLFNIGTGQARTWNDVAGALFAATAKPGEIDYIPMPEELQGQYQYYTCADMAKLQASGCEVAGTSLEDAVADYVQNYLGPEAFLASD
ncbi:MAG: ADP-glyceromanno-heptose 6-epimerase [Desulfosarcina sp.]|nr:ADP-glyceromanno-heptose 6-epimerase [Desulfobacterales bacterium]